MRVLIPQRIRVLSHSNPIIGAKLLTRLRTMLLPWMEIRRLRQMVASRREVEARLRRGIVDRDSLIGDLQSQLDASISEAKQLSHELIIASRAMYEKSVLAREFEDLNEDERARRKHAENVIVSIANRGRHLVSGLRSDLRDAEKRMEQLENATQTLTGDNSAWEELATENENKLNRLETALKESARTSRKLRKRVRETEKASAEAHDLCRDFLPEIDFAKDSYDHLMSSKYREKIVAELKLVNDGEARGERIRNTEWLETRPAKRERAYYRKSFDGRKYIVLLNDKNRQKRDVEWMQKN